MGFRGLVRAVQRQWIPGSLVAALLLTAGAALLPFAAPVRSTGRLVLAESGPSPAQAEALILGDGVLSDAAKQILPAQASPEQLAREVLRLRGGLSLSSRPPERTLILGAATPELAGAVLASFERSVAAAREEERRSALARAEQHVRTLKTERDELLRSGSEHPQAAARNRLRSLENDLGQEENELASTSARLDRLAQRIERNESSGIAQPVDTRESDRLAGELAQARRERGELQGRSPADPDALARTEARIEDLKTRIALALNRETLGARFAPVREMIDETRRLFAAKQRLLDSVHWRRAEIERLRAESRLVPVSLPPDRDQVRARLSTLESAIQTLDLERKELASRPASAPTHRLIRPGPARRAPWAWPSLLLGALLGGLLACLVREALCGTLRTQHDVLRYVNLPLLGQLPQSAETSLLRGAPESLVEAFRSSALLIEAKARAESLKLLALTSAGAGEGKSTTAAGLAVTLARNGLRVLLVDADLRRPSQHRLFGAPSETGLSTYLSGAAESLDSLLVATELENLVLLPAGPPLENPPGWFRSERFQSLCRDLRGWYDLTLIDLPPVQGAAEALVTAAQADGILLVAAAGRTGKDAVTEAKRLIRASGGKLWGCVLTRTGLRSRGYDYYTAVPAPGGGA